MGKSRVEGSSDGGGSGTEVDTRSQMTPWGQPLTP